MKGGEEGGLGGGCLMCILTRTVCCSLLLGQLPYYWPMEGD